MWSRSIISHRHTSASDNDDIDILSQLSQLLDLESSLSMESKEVVDFGLLVGSQSDFGVELEYGSVSVTGSGMVVDCNWA